MGRGTNVPKEKESCLSLLVRRQKRDPNRRQASKFAVRTVDNAFAVDVCASRTLATERQLWVTDCTVGFPYRSPPRPSDPPRPDGMQSYGAGRLFFVAARCRGRRNGPLIDGRRAKFAVRPENAFTVDVCESHPRNGTSIMVSVCTVGFLSCHPKRTNAPMTQYARATHDKAVREWSKARGGWREN